MCAVCAPIREKETHGIFIPNTQLGPLLEYIYSWGEPHKFSAFRNRWLASSSLVGFHCLFSLSLLCKTRASARAFHINWQPFNDFVSSDRRESPATLSFDAKGKMLLKEELFLRRRNQFCFGATRSPAARVLERSGGGVLCLRISTSIDAALKFVFKRTVPSFSFSLSFCKTLLYAGRTETRMILSSTFRKSFNKRRRFCCLISTKKLIYWSRKFKKKLVIWKRTLMMQKLLVLFFIIKNEMQRKF